jgi:tight adherence protein B
MQIDTLIIGGIIALVLIVAVIVFFMTRRKDESSLDARLEQLDNYDDFSDFMDAAPEQQEAQTTALEQSRTILQPINDALSNAKWGQSTREKLTRADLKITVAEFAASHFIAGAVGFLVGFAFLAQGDVIFASFYAAIGLFVPGFYVNRRVNQRLYAFESQLPDTLGLWVNALRSGYSVLQAMEAIAQDAPEPTKQEFQRVVKEVQIGIAMQDALQHMLDRIDSEDLDLCVTAVNIQREVGGNLAEILEVISHTIRERIKLKGEIRVLTAQGRMTGYLISFLPIGLAAFLNFASPGYMGEMFTNRLCGWPLLGLGLALIGIGTAIIQKIVDVQI